MNVIVQGLSQFFIYALVAVFAQNAVFARGFGVSRLVQLVGDDDVQNFTFGSALFLVQLIVAPVAYYANRLLLSFSQQALVRPLVCVLCIILACGIVLGFVKLVQPKKAKSAFFILPMAAFNSCVMGTLLITAKQDFTLLETVAFGVGSAVGYMLAVAVISEAQRKLRSNTIPNAFKGLPITLIYMGVLALAIYGFTGHTVAI